MNPKYLFSYLILLSGLATAQDSLSFGGVYELPGAEVRATYDPVSPLAQRFTIEEIYRLPGTFYDPARLVALLPGVVQTNDQANHLSVRGNSPNANLWRVNGLAIVNPNHTANAGTFYDFPAVNGGGVNAISAQVLGNGGFYSAGLPIEYGYATGGTFDLRLRPGSKTGHRQQVQAGFIGFDGTAEGPLGKAQNLSYLVNARYSFTGLLGDAGVDFGGEEIRFADLNFHLHHKTERSRTSFFGVLGASTNVFGGPDPAEETLEEQKELFDISFDGDLAVGGLTHERRLRRGELKLGFAGSSAKTLRLQDFRGEGLRAPATSFRLNNQKYNAFLRYERPLSARLELKVGAEMLHETLSSRFFADADLAAGETQFSQFRRPGYTSISPYASVHWLAEAFTLDLGVRQGNYLNVEEFTASTLQPRLAIGVPFGRGELSFVAESLDRVPLTTLLNRATPRNELFVNQTNQLSFSYGRPVGKLYARLTAYAQRTQDERTATVDGFRYSANNLLEADPFFVFDTVADTRRFGLELELAGGNKAEGWYYRGSLSVFDASTEQADGDWAKDRFATDFIAKVTLGREWAGVDKRQRGRSYGLNLAFIARGGERYGNIVAPTTRPENILSYFARPDHATGFSNQLGTYFRPDLRLYKTKTRRRTTTTLALDLQNAAGIRNVGSVYYDAFLERPNERTQLGLIPVLSYRIVWR